MSWKTCLGLAVLLIVVLQVGACAQATYDYMLSATALGIKEGNYGTSYFVAPDLTLTAITRMNASQPMGETGTLYFDKDLGLGVQNGSAGGSQGISGGGPDGDEAAVFAFSTPVITSSPTLLLNSFAAKDDDPQMVVTLADGSIVSVPTASIEAAAKLVSGSEYSVAFSDLPELAGKGPLSSFYVREWTGHLYVSGLRDVQQVPEPTTMAGFALGALGLGGFLRRRRQRRSA